MTKFLHKINTHENYIKNVTENHKFNITLCKDEYHLHYDKWIDPYNGHEYVEIGGLKWATMNVGANSITDTGLYFQWGDTQGYTAAQVGTDKTFNWESYKHWTADDGSGSSGLTKYNSTDGKTVLEASDDAAVANWGGSWRMPTADEYVALMNATTSAYTYSYEGSGVAGLIFTSKDDTSKKLFFPATGFCYNGSMAKVGENGNYWLSSLYGDNVYSAYCLLFEPNFTSWPSSNSRKYGQAVRPVVG